MNLKIVKDIQGRSTGTPYSNPMDTTRDFCNRGSGMESVGIKINNIVPAKTAMPVVTFLPVNSSGWPQVEYFLGVLALLAI